MRLKDYLVENGVFSESSTDDAKETLQAIIATAEKSDSDSSQEILKMAKEIMDYYKNEGSFSPGQANWIYKTSQAMFNK